MKKLSLKKVVISSLDSKTQQQILGGGTEGCPTTFQDTCNTLEYNCNTSAGLECGLTIKPKVTCQPTEYFGCGNTIGCSENGCQTNVYCV